MSQEELSQFREKIDNDDGLKSKRKILITIAVILIGMNCSGAVLQEANTFIFKIKLTNHPGLIYFISISLAYMTLRYYGYAQAYHAQLFNFWSQRMLSDYRVFSYTPTEDDITGLLGKRIDIWTGDEPGLQSPRYKVIGLFKRNLVYDSHGQDDTHGVYSYIANIELNKLNDDWKFKDFLHLLIFEARYQIESLFKYREYLDLLFPYLISLLALLTLFFRNDLLV
ncbi:hypothetical protein [Thalassotalea sp. ND16A]|uniref:hypothetical protein n=1 Tax=Thalassotalea sp. ND16A TaxID=1535422 RepID=UPI00051A3733|nr:hypothetical protein [Thalassotalea sp. ND16A]KGJ98126.1 hypothetical protein ND16A_0931 [Thalassotalea sp. ND16A]